MNLSTYKLARVTKSCAMMTAVAMVLVGCGNAVDPLNPDNTVNPNSPANPSNPVNPGNTGNPGNSDNPGNAGNAGNPGNTGNPGNPNTGGQNQSRVVLRGNDQNNIGSALLSLNPDGPGGSPNQSLVSTYS